MAYLVQLDNFEGPLDLLLHLVQREELDIYDIPIARIAQQYLATLEAMQVLDLDVASEFLVMAATLLQIKSRMLFPRPSAPPLETPDAFEGDPRQELIERLLVYSRFKQAAQFLAEREVGQARHFLRFAELPDDTAPADPLGSISLFDLLASLHRALHRAEPAAWPEIPREAVTLRDRMAKILLAIRAHSGGVLFRALLGQTPRRLEVVVTFLAVLELLRLQQVQIVQVSPFGELLVQLGAGTAGSGAKGAQIEEGEGPA